MGCVYVCVPPHSRAQWGWMDPSLHANPAQVVHPCSESNTHICTDPHTTHTCSKKKQAKVPCFLAEPHTHAPLSTHTPSGTHTLWPQEAHIHTAHYVRRQAEAAKQHSSLMPAVHTTQISSVDFNHPKQCTLYSRTCREQPTTMGTRTSHTHTHARMHTQRDATHAADTLHVCK